MKSSSSDIVTVFGVVDDVVVEYVWLGMDK